MNSANNVTILYFHLIATCNVCRSTCSPVWSTAVNHMRAMYATVSVSSSGYDMAILLRIGKI